MAKLCLGMVQFGMDYGINNKRGKPSKENAFYMLDLAIDSGIKKLDTAFAYGNAEELLGEYFTKKRNLQNVEVITKLRPNILDFESGSPQKIVREALCKSLDRMCVSNVDGFLLHTPEYIYNEDILDGLEKVKKEGLTNHIGISIYEIKDGVEAIKTGMIDYIQLPYSVLDQRGMKEGFLKMAKSNGVQVYCRSAFLQGLVMMEPEKIPDYMNKSKEYVNVFDNICKKYEVDKVTALLHFVIDNEYIDYLVFGVDTQEQLIEDIKYAQASDLPKEFYYEIETKLGEVEKSIIFPSLWKK